MYGYAWAECIYIQNINRIKIVIRFVPAKHLQIKRYNSKRRFSLILLLTDYFLFVWKNGKKRKKTTEMTWWVMNHLAFAIIIDYRSCLPENVLIINQNKYLFWGCVWQCFFLYENSISKKCYFELDSIFILFNFLLNVLLQWIL